MTRRGHFPDSRGNASGWTTSGTRRCEHSERTTRTGPSRKTRSSTTSTACYTHPTTGNASRTTSRSSCRRVPLAADFHAFADAGHELSDLHLGYEHCAEYPLEVELTQPGEPGPEHFQIGRRAMRFKKEEHDVLKVNEHIAVTGIPSAAHEYQVNGRSPLEWFIDRYRSVQDRASGIVNDPNRWFEQPEDLITAIRRIVHVSVETSRIVRGLPEALAEDEPRTIAGQGGRG